MPLNIDWQQILLHLFNVTLLFAVLYFLLYSPIKKFMQKRSEHFLEMEREAERKLADADAVKKEQEEKQVRFDEEMAGVRSKIEAEARDSAEKTLADAKKEAEKILEANKANAQREKEKILQEASAQISEMAVEAAKKVVMESTSGAYDSFLDSAKGAKTDE